MSARLLIIDDDEKVTETFAMALRLDGYEVRTANNAAEGLQRAQAEQPDAILVDLRMPFVNGLGFLYRLRSKPGVERTPVAMITGDVLQDTECDEIQALGAELHYKPFWINDLPALVRRLASASIALRS